MVKVIDSEKNILYTSLTMENRALFSAIGIALSCVALPQCTDLRGTVHLIDMLQKDMLQFLWNNYQRHG